MPVTAVRLTRSRKTAGDLVVRLGVPLLDEYLEFLAGRCRPNTVLCGGGRFLACGRRGPRTGNSMRSVLHGSA
jgi:hypothetical protein